MCVIWECVGVCGNVDECVGGDSRVVCVCYCLFVWVRDCVWTRYQLISLILIIIISMFVVMRGSRSCRISPLCLRSVVDDAYM